ncbi:hypothetical protein ABKN59_003907 [Abortiporus biennis]
MLRTMMMTIMTHWQWHALRLDHDSIDQPELLNVEPYSCCTVGTFGIIGILGLAQHYYTATVVTVVVALHAEVLTTRTPEPEPTI